MTDKSVTNRARGHGQVIAIDIESGDYELDVNDRAAVKRLRSRLPSADIDVARVGHPAAHRIRTAR